MDSNKSACRRALVLSGILALSAACASREPTGPALEVSLSIGSGGQTVFEVLQSLQLTAIVRDTGGAPVTGQAVAWTSSDTTIASVSSSGVVNGKKPGMVIVTAACDGSRSEITRTVAPPVVTVSASAEVEGSLAVGGTMYVYATASDANGNQISGLPIGWSSSSNSLATVSQFTPVNAGVVSAIAAGNVSITATIGGVSGATSVTIVPVSVVASIVVRPATVTFVAGPTGFATNTQMALAAKDAAGNDVIGVPTIWSISNPSAATLSATGLLTPNPDVFYGSMATATVTATVAALSASVPVVVCPEVAKITVSTAAISLQVGQSVVVVATALDARGNPELAPLGTEIVFPTVARNVSVQRTGFDSLLVTAIAPGTATLDFRDATSGIQSQTIPISVDASSSSAERADRSRRDADHDLMGLAGGPRTLNRASPGPLP